VDHTKHEFEEQKEHDEKHEELVDDKLQPTTKKTKASLAHTQRKTRNGDQGTIVLLKKGKKKVKPTSKGKQHYNNH